MDIKRESVQGLFGPRHAQIWGYLVVLSFSGKCWTRSWLMGSEFVYRVTQRRRALVELLDGLKRSWLWPTSAINVCKWGRHVENAIQRMDTLQRERGKCLNGNPHFGKPTLELAVMKLIGGAHPIGNLVRSGQATLLGK